MRSVLNKDLSVVILAAGFGLRLKNNKPKAMVEIEDGKTILDYQLNILTKYVPKENIHIVVGYKKNLIMKKYPDLNHIYNQEYGRTNTSKSLLKALKKVGSGDVLWLNGDVVFDEYLIQKIINKSLSTRKSCILTDNKRCGEEEVKYSTNQDGHVELISKEMKGAEGEALGINLVVEEDLPFLVYQLSQTEAQDYFEKGIENMITENESVFMPVNTNGRFCSEIDYPEDLESVQDYLKKARQLASVHI